jgi:hypothetical protein
LVFDFCTKAERKEYSDVNYVEDFDASKVAMPLLKIKTPFNYLPPPTADMNLIQNTYQHDQICNWE